MASKPLGFNGSVSRVPRYHHIVIDNKPIDDRRPACWRDSLDVDLAVLDDGPAFGLRALPPSGVGIGGDESHDRRHSRRYFLAAAIGIGAGEMIVAAHRDRDLPRHLFIVVSTAIEWIRPLWHRLNMNSARLTFLPHSGVGVGCEGGCNHVS